MTISVDKPSGMTSHDVVNLIRKISGVKKVGHGGTLDPMASGVLVIGIGREATKQLHQSLNNDKEYLATIRLDGISDTDDVEGEIKEILIKNTPELEDIEKTIDAIESVGIKVFCFIRDAEKWGKKSFEPKEMMGEISDGMIFDIGYADGVTPVLAMPEKPVPDGTRVG